MQAFCRRIIAFFAAVAVLGMSANCACGGAFDEASCHAGEYGHHHREHDCDGPEHPKPCHNTCEHCQQSIMNDTVGGYCPAVVSAESTLPSFHAIQINDCESGDDCLTRFLYDLPPLIPLPTLLNLHCALTT